jgi:hypothetical protein
MRALLLLLTACSAFDDTRWETLRFNGTGELRLDTVHALHGERPHEVPGTSAVTLDLRALAGRTLATGLGFGFSLGAGLGGGFLYDVIPLRVGAGLHLGVDAFVFVDAGVGFAGITNRIPIDAAVPIEARAEFGMGPYARLLLRGAWRPEDLGQLQGSIAMRFGGHASEGGASLGSGYAIGFLAERFYGTTFLGGVIEFHMSGGH